MNVYERLNAERDADWKDFCENPTEENWRNFAESDARLKALDGRLSGAVLVTVDGMPVKNVEVMQ